MITSSCFVPCISLPPVTPVMPHCFACDESGNASLRSSTVVSITEFNDGLAQSIVLPNWALLTPETTVGAASSLEGNALLVNTVGDLLFEFKGFVLHSWGRYVIFGATINDGPKIEIGRVLIESNEPVLVYYRQLVSNVDSGDLVKFYISSDFEWAQFTWQDIEITLIGKV